MNRKDTATTHRSLHAALALLLCCTIVLAPRASQGQSADAVVQLTTTETTLRCAADQHIVLRPVDARSVVGQCVTPAATPTPPAAAATVREAFFYNPPRAPLTVAEVATRASWIVGHGSGTRYRDELRAAGYTGRVLRYLLANEVEGPPAATSASPCDSRYDPFSNQAAWDVGDFCRLIHPHEDWFLHNGKGERLYLTWHPGRRTYAMNSAHPGWRAFALQRMEEARQGYDGILLDNVELDIYKLQRQYRNSDGVVREFATNDAFCAAMIGYLQALAPLRRDGGLQGNFINDPLTGTAWDAYLPHVDGVLQEAWATGYDPLSPDRWDRNLRQAETALAQGKDVVMVARGAQGDERQLLFGLASYLLVTNGSRAYFRYSDDRGQYVRWPQHALYDVQLGAARGPRYRLPDGRWQRDFERGRVTVDSATRVGTITPYP